MLFRRSSSRSSITASSLRERSEVLLDLAEGIPYFHSQTILHRDLKPCNIGFDHDGVLKLFDFDVSRLVPFCNNPNKEVFWLTRATRRIASLHESRSGARHYNLKADVYSFCLLCYELLSLQKPYGDLPADQHALRSSSIISKTDWPQSILQCLEHCWSESISKRPTMKGYVID
jgi:serine/threonine protein kinase